MVGLAIFYRALAQQVFFEPSRLEGFPKISEGASKTCKGYFTKQIGSRWAGPLLASTVLEQDHFCSDFLAFRVTVLTNSQNPDDELCLPQHRRIAQRSTFQVTLQQR